MCEFWSNETYILRPFSSDCGTGIRYRTRGCYPELDQCRGLPLMEELCENDCCFDSAADTEGILGTTRGKAIVLATLLVVVRILVIMRKSRASGADDQAEWRAAAVRAGEEGSSLVSSRPSSYKYTCIVHGKVHQQ